MAYLSLEEFKDWRDIEGSGDDSVLSDLIGRAQKAIDTYTGRTFEGEAADRSFDSQRDVKGRTLYVDSAGDLASISSITNGDGSTVSSSDYVTEPRHATEKGVPIYAIKLKQNVSTYWRSSNGTPEDAITVNGVWAYSAEAPNDIVQATALLVGWYYDQRDATEGNVTIVAGTSISIPRGMPPSVKSILEPYVRRTF